MFEFGFFNCNQSVTLKLEIFIVEQTWVAGV